MHTALARYSSSGDLEGVADVPIDDVVYLPNRFVTVDNKGTAYFLQPLSTEVLVVDLTFQPRETVSLPEGATQEQRSRSTTLIVEEDFAAAVLEASKDEPYEGARGRITREQILKNAYAYLNLEWRVTPENYGKSSDNTCSAPRNWRRPKRLNGRLGGCGDGGPIQMGRLPVAELDQIEARRGDRRGRYLHLSLEEPWLLYQLRNHRRRLFGLRVAIIGGKVPHDQCNVGDHETPERSSQLEEGRHTQPCGPTRQAGRRGRPDLWAARDQGD
jgi:hypothetical protein